MLSRIIATFKRDKQAGGNFWETFDRKIKHRFVLHWYQLWNLKKYWKKGRVLNVGAGRDCRRISDNIVDVDLRYQEDEYTKSHGTVPKPHVIADAHYLPFKEKVFDTVMSLHLLEHLEDPVGGLMEMLRVTKGNGVVCGAIPDGSGNAPHSYWRDKTHIQLWTRYTFGIWLFTSFGLQIAVIQYCRMKRFINRWSFDFALRKTQKVEY
jgi:SAM-dependent methyltransferase